MTPDLRLAGFAVSVWLSALACLHLSAGAGFVLAAGAFALAAAGALLPRVPRMSRVPRISRLPRTSRVPRMSRLPGIPRVPGIPRLPRIPRAVVWMVVAGLIGVGCGAVATAARVLVRESGPLRALVGNGSTVHAEVVVREDPRSIGTSAGQPPTYLVAVDLISIAGEDPPVALRLRARALVLGSHAGWRPLLPGQRATAIGRLLPPRGGDLRAAVISVREPPVLHGRSSWAQRAAGVLRAGLQRACEPLPDDAGGLLPGLVVGDTSRLDPSLEADFRATGMTHLNAVSRANVH